MTDVDFAEMRRVLRDHGEQVPERGRLSADHVTRYGQIIAADGEYQGGVTAADFDGPLPGQGDLFPPADLEDQAPEPAPGPPPEADPGPPPAGLNPETPPRPGTAPRGKLFGRRPAPAAAPGARKKRKTGRIRDRVPTGPLIERVWSELAWSASKVPPLQRVLAAQAPMAGVVLEDATRNTFVDRGVLQFLARGEDRFEAVNAMIGPPMFTTAIIRFGGFDVEPVLKDGAPVMTEAGPLMRPIIGSDGMPLWNDQTRVMIGGLRFSLMSWLRIGQRHAAEIIERAEELDQLGSQADALIRFILSPPVPGQSFADMQREARQRVGVFLADEATGHAYAEPEPAPGEATAPAPATPGHGAVVAAGLGWPPQAAPDARTLSFTPPDPRVASRVVPSAVVPQA